MKTEARATEEFSLSALGKERMSNPPLMTRRIFDQINARTTEEVPPFVRGKERMSYPLDKSALGIGQISSPLDKSAHFGSEKKPAQRRNFHLMRPGKNECLILLMNRRIFDRIRPRTTKQLPLFARRQRGSNPLDKCAY